MLSKRAVVALETAIYTHGFPYPENLKLAHEIEETIRSNGAIPATVGIMDGKAIVGLSSMQLERLAAAGGAPNTVKVSRRDLAYVTGIAAQFS